MTRKSILAVVLAAACAAPVVTTPGPAGFTVVPRVGTRALRRAIDSVTNAPEFANGHWGVLVVNTRGDTLYSRNAGKLFMPASNQKIITSAVALALLGSDYRYRTTFVAHGPIENGVLQGDLGIIGRGDPSMSDHMRGDAMQPLLDIADSLAARGIKVKPTKRQESADSEYPVHFTLDLELPLPKPAQATPTPAPQS